MSGSSNAAGCTIRIVRGSLLHKLGEPFRFRYRVDTTTRPDKLTHLALQPSNPVNSCIPRREGRPLVADVDLRRPMQFRPFHQRTSPSLSSRFAALPPAFPLRTTTVTDCRSITAVRALYEPNACWDNSNSASTRLRTQSCRRSRTHRLRR